MLDLPLTLANIFILYPIIYFDICVFFFVSYIVNAHLRTVNMFIKCFDIKRPYQYIKTMRLQRRNKSKFGHWMRLQINDLGLDWMSICKDLNLKERTFRRIMRGDVSLRWDVIVISCEVIAKYSGKRPIEHIIDCVIMMSEDTDNEL